MVETSFLRKVAIAAAYCAALAIVAVPGVSSVPSRAVSAAEDGAYRLDVGDRVRVTVFGEDTLSGEFPIGSTGFVALPLLGDVNATGLTLAQFQSQITAGLANGILKNPKVTVEVTNYRPFYILGEVNKPGEYPFAKGMTVLNAVAKAEGFTYRASTRIVSVRHAGEDVEVRERLDVGTTIRPGDTVRIRERWF